MPPPLLQLHMLQGDGRQRGWLQFTPDVPGTIRNHFLPICLIAALAYTSDLLCLYTERPPMMDLPLICQRLRSLREQCSKQPSKRAGQLPAICQLLVKRGGGGSLSLFKAPIHTDLLKVLMLILLSLRASGNGGHEAVGRSWATLFCSPIAEVLPNYCMILRCTSALHLPTAELFLERERERE